MVVCTSGGHVIVELASGGHEDLHCRIMVPRRRIAACLVLGLAGLLTSCGGNGDDGRDPAPPPVPPRPPLTVSLPESLAFASADLTARAAHDFASAQVEIVRAATALTRGCLTALTADGLVASGGDCWTAAVADTQLQACPYQGGWLWTGRVAGRTALDGFARGHRGDFYRRDNADSAVAGWQWLETASGDTVEWSFTPRPFHPDSLQTSRDVAEDARLWVWRTDSVQVAFRIAGIATVGWLEVSDGDYDRRWTLREEIAWDAGHGKWVSYDAAGREIERRRW
jgi:hypothetical protein